MSSDNASQIDRLLLIMQKLRDPSSGCPWDLNQDFSSIVPYTIEETYELADAIAKQDFEEIKDELADVLFQVIFYAQLGKEKEEFDFDAIVQHLCNKLIRRHPHVFSDEKISNEAELQKRWEEIKRSEKTSKRSSSISVFDTIANGLPSMTKAEKLQKNCAKVGFDWPDVNPVFDKVLEEVEEIKDALNQPNNKTSQEHITEEVGDLLFAVINLARHLEVSPEQALRSANTKFEKRFRHVEQQVKQNKQTLNELSLEQLEQYWINAKHRKTTE